jgi:hypothetical protein
VPSDPHPGSPRKHCSPEHRRAAWEKAHPRQKPLDWTPPAVALIPLAVPPHDPGKREALKRAARHILALLQDGQAHSRHELARVGGNRYVARLAEIRAALDGRAVVLGPRPYRGVRETEAMLLWVADRPCPCRCGRIGGPKTQRLELYRLEWRA